jgi:hypothetical protein
MFVGAISAPTGWKRRAAVPRSKQRPVLRSDDEQVEGVEERHGDEVTHGPVLSSGLAAKPSKRHA